MSVTLVHITINKEASSSSNFDPQCNLRVYKIPNLFQKRMVKAQKSTIHLLLLLLPKTYSFKKIPATRSKVIFSNLSSFQNVKGSSSLFSGIFTRNSSNSSPLSPSTSTNNNNTQLKMAHMDSPSAQRNKGPIWSVLKDILPKLEIQGGGTMQVLEIAAGVGVHTLHFTTQMVEESKMNVKWFASDPDEQSRSGILSRIQSCENQEVKESLHSPPLSITLCSTGFQDEEENVDSIISDNQIHLMICINMIHISPWEATIGLFKVASTKLNKDGVLYCYGPYKENGTAVESNL